MYHELAQVGASSVGERRDWPYSPRSLEQLIALAAEMMRYDPRLLDVLVQWLLTSYRELNPVRLREHMREMRWPQSLLVALWFARLDSSDQELHWFSEYVARGFPRVAPTERFFADAERPGSRSAARNLGRNLAPYARWGFVGQDRQVVDPITKRTIGRYDVATRRRILSGMLQRGSEISLADYLSALDYSVTRQQAQKDLGSHGLIPSGRGRSARWRVKAVR